MGWLARPAAPSRAPGRVTFPSRRVRRERGRAGAVTHPTKETLRGRDGPRTGPFLRTSPPAAGCAKGRDERAVDAGGAVEAHQPKMYIGPSSYPTGFELESTGFELPIELPQQQPPLR